MKLIFFETIDSTNAYAKREIDNLADRVVICAETQSAGYGRFQRTWVDVGAENIYMTLVLKPAKTVSLVHASLTQYLALCLCLQLEQMGLKPKLKWPNDVLVKGKKISGILAETVIKGSELKGIVLGIGINLNSDKKTLEKIDRPATSLNLELGKDIDKQAFIEKLVDMFFDNYEHFLKTGFSLIKSDYEKRAAYLNENVGISIFNSQKDGKFVGFDDNGNLLLETANSIESINMGEFC